MKMETGSERVAKALAGVSDTPALPIAKRPFAPTPDALKALQKYTSIEAERGHVAARLKAPLYANGANSVEFDGSLSKDRGAPAQPSARVTFRHRF